MTPLIPDWLVESGLSANQIAVLSKLWRHKGKTPPFQVWPARAEILRCVPMNKDTLSCVLRDLEKSGFLKRKTTWRSGHKAIVFELIVPTVTIVRNEGTIHQDNRPGLRDDPSRQSSEIRGVRSSETEGVRSSENRGREVIQGSNTMKLEGGSRSAPPDSWPLEISAPDLDVIATESGRDAEIIKTGWKMYRARKVRYGDSFQTERFDGFTDYLRNPKEGGMIRKESEFKNAFDQPTTPYRQQTTPATEPEHWREAMLLKYPGAIFLDPKCQFYAKTYQDLKPEYQTYVIQAIAEWKAQQTKAIPA